MTEVTPPPWTQEADVKELLAALAAAGGEGRFVGGCVRDSLLGRPIQDVDIATPLLPDAVMRALKAADLGAVPTGIEHGTVTALVRHRPFEITTLRHDIETDGRHATVVFTDDWRLDAERRDLTMNALFLDAEGRLYDYVGGAADLAAGLVRFVGDPARRITEDYLRILRFLRFHAHYAKGPPDPPALAAATELASGLSRISAERKAKEVLRLLEAQDPLPVIRIMAAKGIMTHVLPAFDGPERLARLIRLAPASDSIERLAALLPPEQTATPATTRALRLSNQQKKRLGQMAGAAAAPSDLAEPVSRRRLLFYKGAQSLLDQARSAAAAGQLALDLLPAIESEAAAWKPLRLPIGGRDLASLGLEGPALGQLLRGLETWWIEAAFVPDSAGLLAEAERRSGQRIIPKTG